MGKWYSAENNPLDIPTFQDLQNVTGQVFDPTGVYIGPAELPKQQLVIDNTTNRQYYAPIEYSENAVRYAQAKMDEKFKPEDWYGMTQIKPHYTMGEQIIGGTAALGKSITGFLAQLPTKITYTGAVFANELSKAYAKNNLTDIAKMKNGMLVEQENLYRMSMKNWENTLIKYGLANEAEIQQMAGGKVGSMIGDVGASLLTAAAVSCVGGLPAVAAVFGTNQFADVMEEGLSKGLSHDKAFSAAWKAGLAEGSLEAFGFKMWRSAATLNKSFRNLALAFAWEAAQEGSQQTAESLITNYYGIREQTFTEILADVCLSALVGGLVGFAGAGFSGQVEQRNLALRKTVGMNEEGRIVTPQKKEEGETIKPSVEAEKDFIQREIAEAKKTGDNTLYNLVKYSANAHGITDEATIDKLYPVARKAISDGATNETLLGILGNQIVAYKNQLEQGQTDTKATQKAVEQIKLVKDPNRVDEWKESRKSELEKIGVEKREARVAMSHFAKAVSNLSIRLGFDITKKYDLQFEKRAPQSETLQQIKDEEELSFDFGANVEANQQKGISTKGKLIETYRTLEEGLKAKKAPMPRRHLLTVLREKGANYNNTSSVDKEAYKNAKVPNRKDGIGDSLSDFLAQHGFMGKGASEAQTYEEASELEQEAADLIHRALSREKIFTLADQEIITKREAQEEGEEWARQEMGKIRVDLTRGQTTFLGKVVKIALGETFDFSTLEHEFFHFIDRVVLDAAREGNPEAQKILAKRNQIIKKAKSELKKQGFIEPKDNEERAKLIKQGRKVMPIDEEILAEAYEKWLWNGAKSEDKAEQGLFNAIREFFREVYDTVKGLVGIRITPEADAYFRAMTGADTMYQPIQDVSFEAEEAIKEQVKKDIEDYEKGKIDREKVISVGMPSTPLIAVGVPNFELKLKQKTIKKDTKTKHKVKMETFKKLPSLLADPILILKSESEPGSFVVVLNETYKKGSRVIAAIDPNGEIEVNYIDSVYGKDNEYWFKNQVEKGNLLYINEEEALREENRLYLRGVQYKTSTNSILTKKDIVKGKTLFQEGIKYDKNGKADINSPEFKKWFGDSKVVDENGKPLVVYHGTSSIFDIFTKHKSYRAGFGGYLREVVSPAFFFTSSKQQARDFAVDRAGSIVDYNVMPVYLNIKNPLDLTQRNAKQLAKKLGLTDRFGDIPSKSNLWELFDEQKNVDILKKAGYDGAIISEKVAAKHFGNKEQESLNTYVAFEPNQIKSVYNRGTFDTESPNIYYQSETNEQLYRNDQAIKEGAKVLDKAPTNEQVEKELATIRSGRVVEAEPKRGFGLAESIGDFVLTVRQRVGTIDKRLKYAFDKLDFNEKMYESKYGKNVVGYIKKYRKLDDTLKRELDYLILNKQDERIREFVRQNDMLEEYNQARTLLDNLYVDGNKAGMDMGFLQEYFPTKVVDPEGLITYLKGTDKWTEIERALAEIDPNNQMSIEDRANAINNILRGYNRADPISKQGFQNERLIFHKTPEMMKFYAPSDEALMRYVSGMSSALAIRNAFNVKNAFNAEESIGGVVQELIKSGRITYKEEAFIRKMLKARLNYARTAPMVALLKNFGYLGTMNNITSAVTQIGDLYANFYKYNFGTAMKALFGKREITKEDLHIDSIWEEFADSGWTGIAVNKLFSAIGLNKFDKFGKETAINGAWIDLKERLKNNDISLLEDLSAAFGSRSKQVMEDIKNNNITEDVKLLLWTQLADTQPLGKSGVPVGYLNNPHGRIVYQLKTYTINQLSLFYADGIYKINKGLATKNKKLFLQGIGNTAKLALLLTIFNASADAIKNLIMGRKIDISDTLLSNMLWNIGVSKYTFYRGQRDGYARALLENYLLPPQISMGDDAYMDIKKIATGKRKPSDTIAVTYVPFGRMWYWWFGGGRTQEKKKGNKPFEIEL